VHHRQHQSSVASSSPRRRGEPVAGADGWVLHPYNAHRDLDRDGQGFTTFTQGDAQDSPQQPPSPVRQGATWAVVTPPASPGKPVGSLQRGGSTLIGSMVRPSHVGPKKVNSKGYAHVGSARTRNGGGKTNRR